MHAPTGAPRIDIPRHPLWQTAYEGALGLWFAQAESIPAHGPAACAFALYARYAHDRSRVAALLDTFHAAKPTSPLLPWVEWAFVRHSGDLGRLATVFPRLAASHARLQASLRRPSGLYADPAPDPTSPREAAEAVDASAQMALGAECLAAMARALGRAGEANDYDAERQALANLINRLCWDETAGFYLDRRADGSQSPVKTTAGLWPLIAGVADGAQAGWLAAHLADPSEFWRVHAFPCLSADHPRYAERGAAGRGSVWPLADYAILHGLERYGLADLAVRAADNHVTTISHVFKETRAHWDNYMPDYIEPGSIAQPDFAPTAGIGSVATLIETVLGLELDAPARTLRWTPRFREAYAVRQLCAGSVEIDIEVTPADGGRFEAALSVSAPLALELRRPGGVQRIDVRDAYRFRY